MSQNSRLTARMQKEQSAKFDLDEAQKDLTLASQQNQDLSKESRKLFDTYYDKILLYSAGAFSFSVALIGLVVNDNTAALSKNGFLVSNIFWLYVSLFFYLITCALVLIARKADAVYAGSFGMASYTEKKKREQETRKTFFQVFGDKVLIPNSDATTEIALCDQNILKINQALPKNQKQRDFYYNIKFWSHMIAELMVSLATILLFIFTTQMIQAIVWG